jgi:hypothetical protein
MGANVEDGHCEMSMRIRISWRTGELEAVLEDTKTARDLYSILPVSSTAQTWGEEVYFEIPMSGELENDARQVVDPGTVCFWVEGSSLAIPFGPTPISSEDECRLVTRVNVLGQVEGDPDLLRSCQAGDVIQVEACSED